MISVHHVAEAPKGVNGMTATDLFPSRFQSTEQDLMKVEYEEGRIRGVIVSVLLLRATLAAACGDDINCGPDVGHVHQLHQLSMSLISLKSM